MSPRSRPRIEVFAHAEAGDLEPGRLGELAGAALPRCLAAPGPQEPVLPGLESVEVSLVSDEAIAGVHGRFLGDPGPTDVITFHHGEILVSADTARREASRRGHSASDEALLYIVHGLLHLNGHEDATEEGRAAMERLQRSILGEVIAPPASNSP